RDLAVVRGENPVVAHEPAARSRLGGCVDGEQVVPHAVLAEQVRCELRGPRGHVGLVQRPADPLLQVDVAVRDRGHQPRRVDAGELTLRARQHAAHLVERTLHLAYRVEVDASTDGPDRARVGDAERVGRCARQVAARAGERVDGANLLRASSRSSRLSALSPSRAARTPRSTELFACNAARPPNAPPATENTATPATLQPTMRRPRAPSVAKPAASSGSVATMTATAEAPSASRQCSRSATCAVAPAASAW